MTAVEFESDDISNGSSDGVWSEGILSTLTNLDSEGGGNGARGKGEKRECVDHLERLYREWMRKYEQIEIRLRSNEGVLKKDKRHREEEMIFL